MIYEGNTAHPLLQRLSHDPRIHKLLAAPLLVCTIDHLIPATESQRGGGQIAPMLRLMSGDLVLDEPDDFDIDDVPALARLVHWAGLLGSRVLLSSATLPPALVQGLFEAYLDGRRWFQRNRGERPGAAPEVCCMWVDEFDQMRHDCADGDALAERSSISPDAVMRISPRRPCGGEPSSSHSRSLASHATRCAPRWQRSCARPR